MVPEEHEGWKLTGEGEVCADEGSPEAKVYDLVSEPCSRQAVQRFLLHYLNLSSLDCFVAKYRGSISLDPSPTLAMAGWT